MRPVAAERIRIWWPHAAVRASMGRMPDDHSPPGGISTRLVSPSTVSADPSRLNDYDSFAAAYSAETETNLINGYYARPAILDLAGRPDRAAELLAPAAACDDRRVYRRGLPDNDHQRASGSSRYSPRTTP